MSSPFKADICLIYARHYKPGVCLRAVREGKRMEFFFNESSYCSAGGDPALSQSARHVDDGSVNGVNWPGHLSPSGSSL